ncbi:MAG: hypothetical protein ACE5IQ_04040 [Candidatus Methylomirabilales bacterium]
MRTLRPAILPDNKTLVVYPVVIGLGVAGVGIAIRNPVMSALPLIILAVFPGLPILFHAVYHFFVKFQVLGDRLAAIDYVSDPFVNSRGRQEIHFGDIAYCFYVDKEANLLLNLLKQLKRHNVPEIERDFRREHLLARYRVPEAVLDDFVQSSQKALNDVTTTGVILEVEEVCRRNHVPKKVRKEICKALETDPALHFESVQETLSPYPVDPKDLDRIRDKFSSLDAPVLSPFLMTKINLKKLRKIDESRHWQAAVKSRAGVVLSNTDGTRKVYLMRFRDLSRKDARDLMATVRDRTPGIKFLMTRKELHALLK